MKFIHTADLHIGKTVNGFSMLEEQKHILSQIVKLANREQAKAVFLCGDLYDRSVAPAQAVKVLDEFLTALLETGAKVFAIAGNHDCGQRISFASRILERQGLFMEGEPKSEIAFADIKDQDTFFRIHMLPFARPVQVRSLYGVQADNFEESVRVQISHANRREGGPNILLTHHFVMNSAGEPETCDSDSRVLVGGTDQVSAKVFKDFDYVALGHLHGLQKIGRRPVYYSGSPLKYSFSEAYQDKAVILGDMDKQGRVKIKKVKVSPLHDMRIIKGKLKDLLREDVVSEENTMDYIMAVLTNEEELFDPINTIRSVYPNVMQLQFSKKQDFSEEFQMPAAAKEKNPYEMFKEFFLLTTGKELSKEQIKMVREAVETANEVKG